jgi:hypothetical protein
MKRVLAVMLIAALTTMMVGVDRTSWASQGRDQNKREKQRAAVTKALAGMPRGTTATVERHDGEKIDVVIQEITPDTIIVLRQERDHAVTETIPIADIAKIKKTSLKKMSVTSKVLIGAAIGIGVLFAAALAACASSGAQPGPGLDTAEPAQ